jgi:hypothetical protein
MLLESLTTREQADLLYCVLHFGAADFRCGVTPFRGEALHREIEAALFAKLEQVSFASVLREIDRYFPGRDYTLRDLFLDERRRVARALLEGTLRRYEEHYREIYDDNLRLMEFLREIDSPIPGPLRVAADVTLTGRVLEITRRARKGELDLKVVDAQLGAVVELARRLAAHLRITPVRHDVEALVLERLHAMVEARGPATRAAEIADILALAERLGLKLDLWDAQNRFWEWAGSPPVTLERDLAVELARRLWFEPSPVLARAGYDQGA